MPNVTSFDTVRLDEGVVKRRKSHRGPLGLHHTLHEKPVLTTEQITEAIASGQMGTILHNEETFLPFTLHCTFLKLKRFLIFEFSASKVIFPPEYKVKVYTDPLYKEIIYQKAIELEMKIKQKKIGIYTCQLICSIVRDRYDS